ncbi:glycosyl transferase family 1, partial [Campylobacter jejuni]|nr:glycosyl transferase family 1 [Campylobacter jejuni]
MNILEYTLGLPPYRRGGLPKYSLDLARQLSTNNNVYLMYPGAMSFWKKKLGFRFKKSNEKFQIIELLDPLPVSLGLGISDEALYMEARDVTKITRLLTDLKIDVVHFH